MVIIIENLKKFHTVRGYQLLKNHKDVLTSGMEDYLEMIYRNCIKSGYIRINTISQLLNVQASSASKMVQKLAGLGFVNYEKYGIIFLTDIGNEIGKFLLNRHDIIELFLKNLGVDENLIIETELIEHVISTDTLQRIETLNHCFAQEYHFSLQYINALKKFSTE